MRYTILGVVVMMLAGCAPTNIARSACESLPLSTADAWSCTVTADIVGQSSSIEFDTESRNHVAKVTIALQVAKGTLHVTYRDLAGEQRLVVTPTVPANLVMQTAMHPDRRSFTLFFAPVGGAVEGLAGTVNYSTP